MSSTLHKEDSEHVFKLAAKAAPKKKDASVLLFSIAHNKQTGGLDVKSSWEARQYRVHALLIPTILRATCATCPRLLFFFPGSGLLHSSQTYRASSVTVLEIRTCDLQGKRILGPVCYTALPVMPAVICLKCSACVYSAVFQILGEYRELDPGCSCIAIFLCDHFNTRPPFFWTLLIFIQTSGGIAGAFYSYQHINASI